MTLSLRSQPLPTTDTRHHSPARAGTLWPPHAHTQAWTCTLTCAHTHTHTTSSPSSLNYLAQVQPPQTSILLHYPHTLTTVYAYQGVTRHAPTKTGTTETQNTQPATFSFITCIPRFPQPQPTPTTTHIHPP